MWKRRNKKYSSGRLNKISLLLVFILIGGLVLALGGSGLFTIKQIDLLTQNISCVDENKLKNSSGLLGQNLFFPNFEKITGSLKEKFICIKDVKLFSVFPSKIKMEVNGRQPVASLLLLKSQEASASSTLENIATPSAGQSRESYLIDNEGIVFAKYTGVANLPAIFLYNVNVSLGKKAIGDNTENGLKILGDAKKLGLDIKVAGVLDDFFILFSYPRVILRLNDKINIQIASLQLILDKAKIDSGELEFIDLRFDKPIVRFAPKN